MRVRVGETYVLKTNSKITVKVVAIHGHQAWCEYRNGNVSSTADMLTYNVSDIEEYYKEAPTPQPTMKNSWDVFFSDGTSVASHCKGNAERMFRENPEAVGIGRVEIVEWIPKEELS